MPSEYKKSRGQKRERKKQDVPRRGKEFYKRLAKKGKKKQRKGRKGRKEERQTQQTPPFQ